MGNSAVLVHTSGPSSSTIRPVSSRQLTLQGSEAGLARLDSTAGIGPEAAFHVEADPVEPHEQDAVVRVQDQRAHALSQPHALSLGRASAASGAGVGSRGGWCRPRVFGSHPGRSGIRRPHHRPPVADERSGHPSSVGRPRQWVRGCPRFAAVRRPFTTPRGLVGYITGSGPAVLLLHGGPGMTDYM